MDVGKVLKREAILSVYFENFGYIYCYPIFKSWQKKNNI